jgi:hypothetical protein
VACAELNNKLSRNGFMNSPTGYYPPIIIPIIGGEPCDDFMTNIDRLKNNEWFNVALKAAVIIDDGGCDSENEVFDETAVRFTGTRKSVLKIASGDFWHDNGRKLIFNIRIVVQACVGAIWEKRWITGNPNQLPPHEALIELLHEYKGRFDDSNMFADENW